MVCLLGLRIPHTPTTTRAAAKLEETGQLTVGLSRNLFVFLDGPLASSSNRRHRRRRHRRTGRSSKCVKDRASFLVFEHVRGIYTRVERPD